MVGRCRRAAGPLAALLAVAAVAGCTSLITGRPVARLDGGSGTSGGTSSSGRPGTSSPPPEQAGANDLLGDLTTLDPCSLTDPHEFARFGTAKLGVPDSLDDCLVEIKNADSEGITLYVGSLDRTDALPDLAAKRITELGGGLKAVEYDADSGYCNNLLVFPDGITLSVNASLFEGTEPMLCDMVKAGMDKAVAVLRAGSVKHREFAGNSLGAMDPCSVVPDEARAAVPGLAQARPRTYPARHDCAWTASDNSTRLRVMFTAGPAPRPTGPGATESSIAGRSSVLSPTPDAGDHVFCGAQTRHIEFRAAGRSGLVEIAAVFVRMRRGQVAAACRAATAVAASVWPRLPTP
ncbi:MAG: hypothetical protein ACJ72N_10305 [Labedaea sp.]